MEPTDTTIRLVAYYRVSTQGQGRTGYGLEAQRQDVQRLLNTNSTYSLAAEYTEIESGRNNERIELAHALSHCKMARATLVIAKLDRLSRNASFLLSLKDSGVEFVCCDMPQANRLTIGILACVAENESDVIRKRTKDAIAVAMQRGVKWGRGGKNHTADHLSAMSARSITARAKIRADRQREMYPFVARAYAQNGDSANATATALNAMGFKSIGGGKWHASTVLITLRSAAP